MPYIIDRPEPERQFINDRAMALEYTERNALKAEGLTLETASGHKYFRRQNY